MTETVGIDLAADPKGTAVAAIAWEPGRASLTHVQVGADDDTLLRWIGHPDGAIGIDCPFGWPAAFVELVNEHTDGSLRMPDDLQPGWRRDHTLRATDRWVHQTIGVLPLSVSADRIGHTAIRLAAIRSRFHPLERVPLDGSGAIAEVYPAAALKQWGLPFRGYKKAAGSGVRRDLLDQLQTAAPWVDLGGHEAQLQASDDALDAVICALIARAKERGLTAGPTDRDLARREGWIHVPHGSLADLVA